MTCEGPLSGPLRSVLRATLSRQSSARAPKVPLGRGRYSTHFEYRVQWGVPQFTDEGKERKAQVPCHALAISQTIHRLNGAAVAPDTKLESEDLKTLFETRSRTRTM